MRRRPMLDRFPVQLAIMFAACVALAAIYVIRTGGL